MENVCLEHHLSVSPHKFCGCSWQCGPWSSPDTAIVWIVNQGLTPAVMSLRKWPFSDVPFSKTLLSYSLHIYYGQLCMLIPFCVVFWKKKRHWYYILNQHSHLHHTSKNLQWFKNSNTDSPKDADSMVWASVCLCYPGDSILQPRLRTIVKMDGGETKIAA